jgi:hypothetical protein
LTLTSIDQNLAASVLDRILQCLRRLQRTQTWLLVLVFVFALACRVVDFNATSVTADEVACKDSGPWWTLLKKGNFSSTEWSYQKQIPSVSRWLYGVLPEALWGSRPSDPYDIKGARVIGAILGAALVCLVYILGREFGGAAVGAVSAFAFSLYPAILGHDRFASHDLPARFASVLSIWFMVKHLKDDGRRDWLWSAVWAGVSSAAYARVGVQTIMVLLAALSYKWVIKEQYRNAENFFRIVGFGLLALGAGFVCFVVTYPCAWSGPFRAFPEVFMPFARVAQSGAQPEWFFGKIRNIPVYYYPAVYVFMCPTLLLLAHFIGLAKTWIEARKAEPPILLWLLVLIPVFGGFSFRASLNHYLLISFPATCVLAALGLKACCDVLGRWKGAGITWFGILATVMIAAQAVTAIRIHPFHLEFFNALVGGTRGVAKNHTFMTGWYCEGINPLFDYVNKHAESNALVNCRLSAWPGISDLRRNLRSDLDVQGLHVAAPLGADYILRVGVETCNQFYRCNPDPERYEKVHDVLALGGSIGDVWKRRPILADSGLVYVDDFTTRQPLHFLGGILNFNFNPFSDGKFYPVASQKPGGVLFRIPSKLLAGRKTIQIQARVQAAGGMAWIQCGSSPDSRAVVARGERFTGWLDSEKVSRPGDGDLWVSLEMVTAKTWNEDPRTFWDYDWFDSLNVRAWSR